MQKNELNLIFKLNKNFNRIILMFNLTCRDPNIKHFFYQRTSKQFCKNYKKIQKWNFERL